MGQYKIPEIQPEHREELRNINRIINIAKADLEERAVKRLERILTERIAERFQRVINELDYLQRRFIEEAIRRWEQNNQEIDDEDDGT